MYKIFFARSGINELATVLAKIAVDVAKILYKKVSDNEPPSIDDSSVEYQISEMLICYLESANCPLFHAISRKKNAYTKEKSFVSQ